MLKIKGGYKSIRVMVFVTGLIFLHIILLLLQDIHLTTTKNRKLAVASLANQIQALSKHLWKD